MLEGIRVLDLGQFIPGPFAARTLSDLGADVIKIEAPRGDPQLIDGPMGDDGVSFWYSIVNRNKRIVNVDLKTEAGGRDLEALLALADVLLESYRPGVLNRLGFSRSRLERINPRLVHCALSGSGQNGPDRLRAWHDINYQAQAGVLDVSGTRDIPVVANPPVADWAGAQWAVSLICAGLYHRSVSGRGSYIDVAMTDATLGLLETDVVAQDHEDFDTRRGVGPYAGGSAFYQVYRAECGRFITLGALEPKFWKNFCEAVGRPDWVDRQYEPRPQQSLISDVQALISTRPRPYWVSLLSDADNCFAEVLALDELWSSPQIAVRQVLARGPDGLADVLLPAWIDETPPPKRRPFRRIEAKAICNEWSLNKPEPKIEVDRKDNFSSHTRQQL